MIRGEIRKILRNKVFLVFATAIFVANMLMILYEANSQGESYYEYKQEEQLQYIETYQYFIEEMGNRGEQLLLALDENEVPYLKRDVEKTERDYAGLENLELTTHHSAGIEEYAGYHYGIFFCMMFAFLCLEYIYIFEKRNAMLQILRTTRKGREQMIASKWLVYLSLVAVYTFLQETMTFFLYKEVYPMGDLESAIQSLQIFRDCSNQISMFGSVIILILNRVLIAEAVSSIIFFCGTVFNNVRNALIATTLIFVLQYIFAITLSVNSSYDKLCCMNLFFVWNMENYFGIYHNLNICGIPIEKNMVAVFLCFAIIACSIFIGIIIFSARYQTGGQKREWRVSVIIRNLFSKILHLKNMFFNELYKLFVQQRKWILMVLFAALIVGTMKQYLPHNNYQTAYEATYHMYLSHTEGKVDKETKQFIQEEQDYIGTLEQMLEEAVNSGDTDAYIQIKAKLEGRREAFNRLMEQYHKINNGSEEEKYLIDEMNLDTILHKYDRDVLLFMGSAILLIVLISGIFASFREQKIAMLTYSTRNGREKLMRAKVLSSFFLTILIFLFTELPGWNGYIHVLGNEGLKQQLNLLYDPSINSSLHLSGMLMMIYLCKLLLYLILLFFTISMAVKSRNEFVTSVLLNTIVIIVCLVFYFLQMNVSMLVVKVLQGSP